MREDALIKSKGMGTSKGQSGSCVIEILGAVVQSSRFLVDLCLILKRVASVRIIPGVRFSKTSLGERTAAADGGRGCGEKWERDRMLHHRLSFAVAEDQRSRSEQQSASCKLI
jgi:hypothetical protein